jgi:hypothetical protein
MGSHRRELMVGLFKVGIRVLNAYGSGRGLRGRSCGEVDSMWYSITSQASRPNGPRGP